MPWSSNLPYEFGWSQGTEPTSRYRKLSKAFAWVIKELLKEREEYGKLTIFRKTKKAHECAKIRETYMGNMLTINCLCIVGTYLGNQKPRRWCAMVLSHLWPPSLWLKIYTLSLINWPLKRQ